MGFRFNNYGAVSGKHRDYSTGYTVDLVSPTSRKHWRFEAKHKKIWFSHATGPRTGNNGFTEEVRGGEVGGFRHVGRGVSGHCQLPTMEEVKRLQRQD